MAQDTVFFTPKTSSPKNSGPRNKDPSALTPGTCSPPAIRQPAPPFGRGCCESLRSLSFKGKLHSNKMNRGSTRVYMGVSFCLLASLSFTTQKPTSPPIQLLPDSGSIRMDPAFSSHSSSQVAAKVRAFGSSSTKPSKSVDTSQAPRGRGCWGGWGVRGLRRSRGLGAVGGFGGLGQKFGKGVPLVPLSSPSSYADPGVH